MRDIQELVELRDSVRNQPAPDIAELLGGLEKTERAALFRLLPHGVSAEMFAYLKPDEQSALLKELTEAETRALLTGLRPDDRTHLLEELPGQAVQRLLNLLNPEDLREARELLGYPEESVGRLMTPEYVAARESWTASEALAHLRARGKGIETLGTVYVTDARWKLLDALSLEQLVLADPSEKIEQVMDRQYITLSPYEDREDAVQTMLKYDLFALPVVDADGVLLGVVTVDDVLDVVEQEATEDFQKGAAVEPLKTSYRESSIWSLYRKRIPWLSGLVLVNLGASGVIAAYEETLLSAVTLAFFIPLLIASGGNTGAQSATLMVRALATGDVEGRQWLRCLAKEIGVGMTLGATMGMAAWILGWVRGGPEIAIIVALAMSGIIVTSNFIGILAPVVLSKLKVDPAVASSPLITSISDVTGLMIYFAVATWILSGGQ